IGGFEATRQWGDLYSLLGFGLLGWVMKQFKWPRPPLILGVVLGDTIERYLFISVERYGISRVPRPGVTILFLLAGMGLIRPFLQDIRYHGRDRWQAIVPRKPGTVSPLVWGAAVVRIVQVAFVGLILAQGLEWVIGAIFKPSTDLATTTLSGIVISGV